MHNKPISEIYSSSDGKNIAKNIAKKSKSALAVRLKFEILWSGKALLT